MKQFITIFLIVTGVLLVAHDHPRAEALIHVIGVVMLMVGLDARYEEQL